MTYIGGLRNHKPVEERKRIASNLLRLKREITKQGVPERTVDETLLLASFNIRDFDSNKFGHGKRLKESFYYLAEMIAAFDLVALQEINDNLSGLTNLMSHLGTGWDYIATDTSGNSERMVFVYDKKKVKFRNIAGEIVLPYKSLKRKEFLDFAKSVEGLSPDEFKKLAYDRDALNPNRQFSRTPFVVSFQSGWFKFKICTVHIFYGATSGIKLKRRQREIREVAKFLKKRADKDKKENYILLGDFNIVSPEHKTMEALTGNGFVIPEEIQKSNVKETMYYDQIAFRLKDQELMPQAANVFTFFNAVYKTNEFETYKPYIKATSSSAAGKTDADLKKYYKDEWRTFQISDHKIMWVELKINFSEKYLKDRKKDS